MANGALTPRQEEFCQQYVIDYNGAAAALRAGYAKGKEGKNQSRVQASRMLSRSNIRARIRELQKEARESMHLDESEVVAVLRKVAHDPMAVEAARVRAMELLGKHIGMWSKDGPMTDVTAAIDRVAKAIDGPAASPSLPPSPKPGSLPPS